MRKILLVAVLIVLVVCGFATKSTVSNRQNESFTTGEVLKYKVHYGIITAAEAVIDTSPTIYYVNNRPCYRATVHGKSNSSFDFFLRIRDTWQSYIDTAALIPQRSFRNIEEGKYRKKETATFNHYNNTVLVETQKKSKDKTFENFKVPADVQDIVSGFYYLRTLDYQKYRIGDVIKVKGFFDDEVFNMDVTYKGRATVSTLAGDIKAIKLVPKMPSNKLFNGEDAIIVYLSDDKNKIPVLIQAQMFVGSVKVDLYEYKNLRHKMYLANR
ncbi:DUF3108 domain-containing protein [Pontibacter harenae]|uniref:DUF3108 domain-containing protein n=1 Tax=Pontibacter harenae TaxID=2894083 RepID=UPI001E41905D|nr:DUF3108 domain-containing protein [Pontibacter harenae]MCC9165931.1 DUF3108 domain-containing protein [Pontibacter harenae]